MNSKINNGNWVVLYYSENCGYCTDFLPIWDLFEKKKNHTLIGFRSTKIYLHFQ